MYVIFCSFSVCTCMIVVFAAVDLCLSLSVSRCTFVLVQITRYQQIIGVYTLQAPTEAAKVLLLPSSKI